MTGLDEPPDDLGQEWEEWAGEILADTEFDTELGTELAREARRLAEGEITSEEFQSMFHDEVVAEFGVDGRKTYPGVPDQVSTADSDSGRSGTERFHKGDCDCGQSGQTEESEPSPGIPDIVSDTSRRKFMGAVGGLIASGAGASAASSMVSAATDEESESASAASSGVESTAGEGTQMGMVIDTERCIACLKCSLACKRENNTDVGVHWIYVFRYKEKRLGQTDKEWLSRPCQHCSDPSCVFVCPTQARHKRWDQDGLVLTDYNRCVGCKYCMVACPYGVNFLGEDEPTGLSPGFQYEREGRNGRWVAGNPPEEVMGKCTFC
ncbi:MAG: 4Fe-4S ferredoxin N-terminal domain-containing protein, partial [Halodesulfurarchaeum sp.]